MTKAWLHVEIKLALFLPINYQMRSRLLTWFVSIGSRHVINTDRQLFINNNSDIQPVVESSRLLYGIVD